VLSDGRFAVFRGVENDHASLSSCEVLTAGQDEHWELMPPMRDARTSFACAAVAGCIVAAGGACNTSLESVPLRSAEVFDEMLGLWLRLPCDLPYDNGLCGMGSALL
jgi:hypothetical protein